LTCAARAEDWHVVQSSGDVWIDGGAQPVALSSTTDVPDGATLTTGGSGRVMLARGEQTMLVGPNSVATIPADGDQKFVTVLQRSGRIEFDVDRQKDPHFAVETPFLAAVVKGTHFVVTVDAADANVAVDRGLVQVTDLATGEIADTPAGQRASVSGPDAKFTVAGSGELAAIVPGTPRAPLVQRLSDADLRALQDRAASGAASLPGLDQRKSDAAASGGLAVIAGNSGGGNGGPGNGGGAGPSGGSSTGLSVSPPAATGGSADAGEGAVGPAGGATLAPVAVSAPGIGVTNFDIDTNAAFQTLGRSRSQPPMATILAAAFAVSVMLAFGFAFLRGRVS
jgi:hypothetical protein